jgi:HK97 family phage prohead protease
MADDVLRRTAPPDLSTRTDGRTVHGIVIPFDQETRVNDGWGPYTEVIKRGAFAKTIRERGDRIKLCVNHDKTVRLPVGKATLLREDAGGVYGEFRVSRTREGDDALELIRDGVVDSFSVGMIPIKENEKRRGYVERTEVGMTETSLVSFPAYEGARISGIRSAYGMDEGEWDRLRDLLRSHPGLLEDLTRDLIIDTPELGAVIHDLDTEVVSEPAEATRSDVPLEPEHTADPQHVPAARPGPMTAERRRELRERVRALL